MPESIASGASLGVEANRTGATSWADLMAEAERDLVVSALEALLRERSNAYRIAVAAALRTGREPPDVADFGLSDVLGLGRRLGSVRLRRSGSVREDGAE